MTYWQFHVVFTLPVLLLLWWFRPRTLLWNPRAGAGRFAVGLTATLAMVYTLPWDNHLIASGAWSYPPERVLGTIGHVPYEEAAFFIINTLMVGWLTLRLLATVPSGLLDSWLNYAVVLALYLGTSVFGVWALLRGGDTFYLGMILGFFAPVLALSWAFAGRYVGAYAPIFWSSVSLGTAYLVLCDVYAINVQGIWSISDSLTVGLRMGGFPLEEFVFFLVVNMLVAQSVMMFSHPAVQSWLPWNKAKVVPSTSLGRNS